MHAAAAVAEAPAPAAELSSALAGRKYDAKGRDRWNDSYYPSGEDAAAVHKPWYIIDAEGQTLGRLAVLAAHYVRCVFGHFTQWLVLPQIGLSVLTLLLGACLPMLAVTKAPKHHKNGHLVVLLDAPFDALCPTCDDALCSTLSIGTRQRPAALPLQHVPD